MLIFFSEVWLLLKTFRKFTSGSIKRIENFRSQFVPARNVDVWLPEGYHPSKKYSVVYMHDGQMLFDSTLCWNKKNGKWTKYSHS